MEDKETDFFGDTHTLLTDYVDDRMLLLKIQAAEKSGKLISTLVTMAVVAIFCFMILVFLSLMGGYYFAELTGSKVIGFGIIAASYVFVLLVFLLLNRSVVSKRINNMVIRIFFEQSASEAELNDFDND